MMGAAARAGASGSMRAAYWYVSGLFVAVVYIYLAATVRATSATGVDFSYHGYEQMTRIMQDISARNPNLTSMYSVGKSVQGRELWVMVVSSRPEELIPGKPNVKYVANMHGNEAVGRELLLHLISYLVSNYWSDPYVRALLDTTRIHLMPSMNPDGFESSREGQCHGTKGRNNARNVDLNRNFPDPSNTLALGKSPEQTEVERVREWIHGTQFVLSANLHGGALVASYPFDNYVKTKSVPVLNMFGLSEASKTPDDDVFQHLAQTYAFNHATMHRGAPCSLGTPPFPNGTTNGAKWYPLTGGMQDYNYVEAGCMEITLELSCCKFPPRHQLPEFWEQNRKSLIKYLAEAHRGVRGIVRDEGGRPLENVRLTISGRDVPFRTTALGEYWRILMPGVYYIQAEASGYQPAVQGFKVEESQPTELDLILRRIGVSDDVITEERHSTGGDGALVVVALGGGGGGLNNNSLERSTAASGAVTVVARGILTSVLCTTLLALS